MPTRSPQSRPQGSRQDAAYSLRLRLKEETEAPFRKVRQFVFLGSGMSAAVGAFISALRILAATSGVRGVQPLSETAPNLAINLGVIGICAFFWKREQDAGARRLQRMSRGARIAKLPVTEALTGKTLRLAEFRAKYRVVIVAGPRERIVQSMRSAQEMKEQLEKCRVMVVPLFTDSETTVSASAESSVDSPLPLGPWISLPSNSKVWMDWLEAEKTESSKTELSSDNVFVVVLRLDGKVGGRSLGEPMWARLFEQITKAPVRDRLGKP